MNRSSTHSAVVFDNVFYSIKKTPLLKNISFEVASGDITGILGPNGAGKTTLLSLINGLHDFSQGSITVLGETLPTHNASFRKKIGVVLQETALYEELTPFENLQFTASLYSIPNPVSRIIEVLELLQLESRSDQIVKTLSGGLKRRIAIARALLHDPELLIIDEPTLGVDVEARHAIWGHLRLLKSKGRTTIVATNYLDEAQALCNKVAVIQQGQLLAYETPQKLIARAGYCIDVECDDHTREQIISHMQDQNGVLRIEKIATGLSIFLKSNTDEKHLMSTLMRTESVRGVRVRAPDLAEVFKIFENHV